MMKSLLLLALSLTTPLLHAQQDPDAIQTPVQAPAPTGGNPVLAVTSWNLKHLGRGGRTRKDGTASPAFDATQASPMLADADILIFQEVNTSKKGLEALRKIARQLNSYTQDHFCMGLSEVPSAAEERYAYLWRQSRVAYVKTDGTLLENCDEMNAITIRTSRRFADQIVREPPLGTFFFRPLARPFLLAAVHLVPKAKNPAGEVPPLFMTFETLRNQPVIVAGDFNLNSTHPAFAIAREQAFAPSMVNRLTSLSNQTRELANAYDNFWYRGLRLHPQSENPRVINLYTVFAEKNPSEIYDTFSDHCPITAWFDFDRKN